MIFQKMTIAGLVNTVSNILRTPVVDNTGLKGFYDFTLDISEYLTPPTDGARRMDNYENIEVSRA